MLILIIGYPGSGKSALAEQMAAEMSVPGRRIYLATMIPYGEDGAARVEKHRRMREGRGFITIEAPLDVSKVLSDRFTADELSQKTVLLECLSNLAANELFERESSADEAEGRILTDIKQLSGMVKDLIIVSNHFEITGSFDEETKLYSEVLDSLNEELLSIADTAVKL